MKKRSFSIYFFLKEKVVNKEKKCPLIGRIYLNNQISEFSCKENVDPRLWNKELRRCIGKSVEALRINNLIENITSKIKYCYDELINDESEIVSAENLKYKLFRINDNKKSIITLFTEFNELIKEKVGISIVNATYQKYERTKNRLVEFLKFRYKVSDISLFKITPFFIEEFECYLRSEYKLGNNYTMKLIQHLKTLYIYITRGKGIDVIDPFIQYKLKYEKRERGFLTQNEILTIINKEITIDRLDKVRDIFIFCCYTGLSYADVNQLSLKNIIVDDENINWIHTERKKTKVPVWVPMFDIPLQIIAKYKDKLPNQKLLPSISNQKMNAYLKEIGDICGIEKNLTCHLARHTFATLSLNGGVSIESVSNMLGHTKISTTQIYAKLLKNKIRDEMNNFNVRSNSVVSALKENRELLQKYIRTQGSNNQHTNSRKIRR